MTPNDANRQGNETDTEEPSGGPAVAADGSVRRVRTDRFDAIELARRAAQRSTSEHAGPKSIALGSGSRIFGLITGTARVGVGASALVAGEIASRSVKLVRGVLPEGIADGPLGAIERQVGRSRVEARRSEQRGRDEVTKVAESVLNRVVVEIVDMLDMEQLIDHVPINRVVARIDLPQVIDEIDLSGIVREGTKGLGGETLDSGRAGLMAVDQWSARFVDKIFRRKEPRDLIVTPERHERLDTTTPEVLP